MLECLTDSIRPAGAADSGGFRASGPRESCYQNLFQPPAAIRFLLSSTSMVTDCRSTAPTMESHLIAEEGADSLVLKPVES